MIYKYHKTYTTKKLAMPRISPETARTTQVLIKKEKVFTTQLPCFTFGVSSRAAQTKLQQWRTYTSYNKNSKWGRESQKGS